MSLLRLGLVALLFSTGCSRNAPLAPQPTTEQEWIIDAVAKDCVGMALFAARPEHWTSLPAGAITVQETAGAERGLNYTLALQLPAGGDPIKSDLKIAGSVWSPELYVPTLRALFARLKLVTPPADSSPGVISDADLLKALANPFTSEIEAQNQRLSGWLQTHPLDAAAHEQAALLLGTLAMRENSGLFWNPRGLCNRATAQLAFARALRPEISESGEVAELLIGLIIDTKADCQKRIAALQGRVAEHPELGPWVTAAGLRNTRDYRLLPKPQNATFLERVELFRAMSEALSSEQAVKGMDNLQPDTAPDWERIVLQVGYGVGSGHEFAESSIRLELDDAVQVLPDLLTGRTPAQFAAIFNPLAGDAVQAGPDGHLLFRVIDLGTWAQFCQRHLLQAGNETYNFLRNSWGVPEEAKKFRAQLNPLLAGLTLYPLCFSVLGADDSGALYPKAGKLLQQHPEWVSDRAWAEIVKHVPASYADGGSWSALSQSWFSPDVPTGTVYGFDWRLEGGHVLSAPALPELQKLDAIAPLKYSVAWLYLDALAANHHATIQQYQQVMAPLLPYYLPAIWGEALLVQNDPAQYGLFMKQAATLNPMYYIWLGKYYLEHHLEPEAAQAYQAAIDHDADAVSVSNSCYWLVNYYYDHGQRDRAMTIAQNVAEVYSSTGLETLAHLLERMDRIPEAESYYQKIEERYDNPMPLNFFYVREATKYPEYAAKIKSAEKQIFPQGLQGLTLAQLTGKPTSGVLVHGENELSQHAGLQPGAIIVGLDGKRVRNMNQYSYIRALSTSPELDLLVYQRGNYQEIHANVPGRLFGLDFTGWP